MVRKQTLISSVDY